MRTTDLKQRWEKLKHNEPNLRIRNAAQKLGVSEAELLATSCGKGATRLENSFKEILRQVEKLGYVMALTRNNEAVHERKGTYLNGKFGAHNSLFVGKDIDLRMFLHLWKFAFAVEEQIGNKTRYSIQFFSKNGEATHKIFLNEKSNTEAYKEIVEEFRNSNQTSELDIEPKAEKKPELPDSEIDVDGFQKEWLALKDTHNFFTITRKYKVTRNQALRIAPEGHATKVQNKTLRHIFEEVSNSGLEIMIFVGNPGCIQIHTGPIKKLMDHNEWFNVLDPEFNLHLKESNIVESWIVRKPTEDGMVHSLELFNDKGENIMMVFGKRKPGVPELKEWKALINETEKLLIL